MKIDGNAIRPGNIISHKSRLWKAVKTQHVKPGKGGAYLQVELKDIRTGTKMNERFRSSETVERVRIEERPCRYLYQEAENHIFMDEENYEQITLNTEIIGDELLPFLSENMIVTLGLYEGEVLSVILPDTVTLTVTETEAVIKGQTQSGSFKPATLENGMRVMVPLHIDALTKIIVNTSDGSYAERAKDNG